jgi:chromosome segregation ATPase
MSEEITQNISDPRPFEERVLALLDSMNTRLKIVEEQSERRALDTKPIWERALAEIGGVREEVRAVKEEVREVKNELREVKEKVSNVERKFDVLTLDMMQLRGDQRRLNDRMDKLESKPV